MKSGHKRGRRSGTLFRWKARWLPTELNRRRPQVQIFYLTPKKRHCARVEVRLTRTRADMYAALWLDGCSQMNFGDTFTLGCRKDFRKATTGKPSMGWRNTVARIYLNKQDLQYCPADTTMHELGHAAMAWARYQRADLSTNAGEEVMMYALGFMAQEITNKLSARGAFNR